MLKRLDSLPLCFRVLCFLMQISIRMPKTIDIWALISMMYFMLSCIGLSMKPVYGIRAWVLCTVLLLASWCKVYAVVMYNSIFLEMWFV